MIVYFIQDVVALFHVWFKLTNNSKRLMNTLSSTLSNFENQIMLKHVFYLNFDRGHSLLYLRRNKVHKNNNHTQGVVYSESYNIPFCKFLTQLLFVKLKTLTFEEMWFFGIVILCSFRIANWIDRSIFSITKPSFDFDMTL